MGHHANMFESSSRLGPKVRDGWAEVVERRLQVGKSPQVDVRLGKELAPQKPVDRYDLVNV